MEPLPEGVAKYYELYTAPYIAESAPAKARLNRSIPRIVKHLPRKGSSVLDLACGAGLFLFALEKKGYAMTGVDVQERMILEARKRAEELASKAKLLVGDARGKLELKRDTFDVVVFLGAVGHFSIEDMSLAAKQAFRVLRPGGVMITELNDTVSMMVSGLYRQVLYEPAGDKDILSVHTKYDGEKGTLGRLHVNLDDNTKFKVEVHIWAPWIFNHVMVDAGFELKDSESTGSPYICVHRKPQKWSRNLRV